MSWRYAVQVVREDGSEVGQVPVRVDWEPAREALRLRALELGVPGETAFLLDCGFVPVWDPGRGQPYVGQVRGSTQFGVEDAFPAEYFGEVARTVTKRMVAEGALEKGDLVRCLPVAFPEDGASAPLTRAGRPAPPPIPVRPGCLKDQHERSGGMATSDAGLPAFIPLELLEQAAVRTSEENGHETGGVLIGHLRRDGQESRLFVEVTAQIPARHTEATSAKLTFTPDTWSDVNNALSLRNRGEIMLGWWHSHPVREWCKDCPPEKRAQCALAKGFLSEDDRLLHRTVFPRAYSLALLANDVDGGPTWSLFGWNRGRIVEREWAVRAEVHHASA